MGITAAEQPAGVITLSFDDTEVTLPAGPAGVDGTNVTAHLVPGGNIEIRQDGAFVGTLTSGPAGPEGTTARTSQRMECQQVLTYAKTALRRYPHLWASRSNGWTRGDGCSRASWFRWY